MESHRFFTYPLPQPPIRAGVMLVSSPAMGGGETFSHTVIQLVNHDAESGSMGLVLNNPLRGVTLQEALGRRVTAKAPIEIFRGGPVDTDRLFFLHTLPEVFTDAVSAGAGLYVGGDFATLLSYINSGYPLEGRLRFFVGYSGWSEGQLQSEVEREYWAVTAPPLRGGEALRGADDAYWHRVVRLMGPAYRSWLRHPKDPSLN